MVRPTDQDIIAIKKIVILTDPKERGHATPQRANGEALGSVKRQRERGRLRERAFTVVCMGRNRGGRVSRLRVG